MRNIGTLVALAITLIVLPLHGIVVDGLIDDWPVDAVILDDPINDLQSGDQDFVRIRITNDAYNLYLLVEFENPVSLRYDDLRLYIDADNNVSTGTLVAGRGMDFSWDFDQNRGTSTLTSRGDIGRGNLIQRIAPETNSTHHEIAISLEALPSSRTGEPIHIALIEENSFDRIPDLGSGALPYTLSGPVAVQPLPINTSKARNTIRIVSWNVWRDSPFDASNQAAFIRILTALQPDIVMFQEIYDTSTETVLNYFRNYLQIQSGQTWQAARKHDCITVSRFPVTGSWQSDNNIVSRHDTVSQIGSYLLIGNAHFPCCENESGRILESGNILDVIDTHLGDSLDAPQATLIGGDLNSGGLAPELIELTTTLPLEMASPRHVYQYDQYTWGSLGSSFGSSRLDFLLFDPSAIFRYKAFIVDTDMLPQDALDDLGLLADDTFISDHLPLVFDIKSSHLPDALQANPMNGDGSTASAWWGEMIGKEYPLVYHQEFGWIWLYESDGGYWYTANGEQWSWTGPEYYPWTWVSKR